MRGRLNHRLTRGQKASAPELHARELVTDLAYPTKKPKREKRGGKVEGKAPHHRLDKRARGGAMKVPRNVVQQEEKKTTPFAKHADGGVIKAGDEAVNRSVRSRKKPTQIMGDEDNDASGPEPDGDADDRARGGGIHIKPSHKGLLHKKLGVPEGKKIPAGKIEAAEHSSSPALRKEAHFADNAKDWNH